MTLKSIPKARTRKSVRRSAEQPSVDKPRSGKAKPSTKVFVVKSGAYTLYGSPARPAHRTAQQIAEAIAKLD